MNYTNPIIKGFHPDPSICLVGDDYYLVTSSFEYFPGVPIFHSKDLVNWTQIGSCVKRMTEFPMVNVKDSGGIWAPTIRYHNGKFYVTATLEHYGNFIISTTDPAGDWSSPVWVPIGGIDPSIFFEDNRAYYCTNQSLHPGIEEIILVEIDVETGRLLGEMNTIWSGIGGGFLEAPHIYHVGEWYYLMTAEGGTNFNHMITLARSRSIWGPYESCPWNPILTNAHDTSKEVQCSGHGDLFQDHMGNWWMVHLAIRLSRRTMSNLGRETFLTPVMWQDGWIQVGNNRKATIDCNGPLWEEQKEIREWKANFYKLEWEPAWIFLRNPVETSYERGEGILKLHPSSTKLSDGKNPTFAAICQRDFVCELEAAYSFEPLEVGDEAGIAIMLSSEFYYSIGKRKTSQGIVLAVDKYAEDLHEEAYVVQIGEGKVNIKVKANKEFYEFYYALNNEPYQLACKASTRFLSCEIAGKCFTGTVMGVYAVAFHRTNAIMEVTNFKIK